VLNLRTGESRPDSRPRYSEEPASNEQAVPGASSLDFELLKNKLELAMLAVKEKQLMLEAATEKKADRNQVELLKIELDRARLLVKEAELNLSAATKKAQTPRFSNTPEK
jgi:hypothetical protein